VATNILVVGDSVSLAAQWPTYIPSRYTIENIATSGATTDDWATDAAPVTGKLDGVVTTPDAIVVYLGINDSTATTSVAAFRASTDTLVADLLSRWPAAQICLVMNAPVFHALLARDLISNAYREQYMQVAEDGDYALPVVDLLGDVVLPEAWSTDGIHPDNETAKARIAAAITASLDTVFLNGPQYQDVVRYALYNVSVSGAYDLQGLGVVNEPYSGYEVTRSSTSAATVTITLNYPRRFLILYNDDASAELDYRFTTNDDWATLLAGEEVQVPLRHSQLILDAAANDVAFRAHSIG